MRLRESQFVRDALHAELAPVLVDRVRAVLVLGVVTTGVSLVVDFETGIFATIWLTKLAAIALYGCAAILVSTARGRSWGKTLAAVLPSACLITVVPGIIGIALRDPLMTAFILSIVTLGGAIVFPWGLRPHLVVVAMASLAFAANVRVSSQLTANVAVTVVSAFGAAAYAAYAIERQRLQRKAVELHQAAQRRALELIAGDASLDTVLATIFDGFV